MHSLALTKFVDCNTRHVECNICSKSGNTRVNGYHHHNFNNTLSRAFSKYSNIYKEKQTRGRILIYLNSLVLNLCLLLYIA